MDSDNVTYSDFHDHYRDSRLYREWAKALDDYGITWLDDTKRSERLVRLRLSLQDTDLILLTPQQERDVVNYCKDAFAETTRLGVIGFADGRFKRFSLGALGQGVLRWCDACQQSFFGIPFDERCSCCLDQYTSWSVEVERLSWFGFAGTVRFHPVDLESFARKVGPATESESAESTRTALEKFLLKHSPTTQQAPEAKPETNLNGLFNTEDADAASAREEGKWEVLRKALSGEPRVHGWPEIEAIEKLAQMYPNFQEVCEHLLAEVRLGPYRKQAQMRVPNLLIVGSPSCGKSSFCQRLAQILAPGDWQSFDLGQNPPDFELVGADSGYNRSKEGRVLRLLASNKGTPVRNPVLILDELDKADAEMRHSVLPALLGLLEKNDAKHFRDSFFGAPVDASGIQFLATANDPNKIKGPLASRFEILFVPDYSPEQFVSVVVPGIYSKWRSEFHEGTFPLDLSTDTCQWIAQESRYVPRRVEPVLARLANQGWREFRPNPTFQSLGNFKEAECENK